MFGKKQVFVEEESVKLYYFGSTISKQLPVFYNPEMKINRDTSLLFIKSYFSKPISYCDPMGASGIREMRFVSCIPEKFSKIVVGDVSDKAIKTMKKHFKINKLSKKSVDFLRANAQYSLSSQYYDMIEIDPFGSPVPFLDTALQRIKHNGVISITATDTASLCGRYPKTGFRRYGLKTEFVLWYEEFGLRGLIAYCQREAAKYDKALTVEMSFTAKHFYKVFFKVEESRGKANQSLNALKYVFYDKTTQDITFYDYEEKGVLGKIYTGSLNNKKLLKTMKEMSHLLNSSKQAHRLLDSLLEEVDIVGYYNPHKLQKAFKFDCSKKFSQIISDLREQGFEVSRAHNNNLGIKTTAKGNDIICVMKK